MSAKEDADALLSQVDDVRARLLAERHELLLKLDDLDATLARLPGADHAPKPVSLADWKEQRRRPMTADDVGRHGQPLNSRDILHATATFFGLTVAALTSQARHASLARARHVAMYLARKHTSESFPEIAFAFGGRDHTTVMSACSKIEEQIVEDAELRGDVESLETVIREAQQALVLQVRS